MINIFLLVNNKVELMKTLCVNGVYCLTDKPVTPKADVYAYG